MKLLRKILVATDFTEASQNALDYAIGVAGIFQSTIYLVHVLPDHARSDGDGVSAETRAVQRLKEINEEIAKAGVATAAPLVNYGDDVDQIIRTSLAVEANLIMLGASSIHKNKSNKLGSSTLKLMRRSKMPVWVAKPEEPFSVQTILCPVDFSAESKRAMDNAVVLARKFSAKLIIFSVYELYDRNFPRFNTKRGGMNNLIRLEHERRLTTFLSQFNFSGVAYENQVKPGEPAEEILAALRENKVDLLIMGTTGRTGLHRLLIGSVTEEVTRELPCTFVTLKAENILTPDTESPDVDVEAHYQSAMSHLESGNLKEAIPEFMICLQINDMHIPSLLGLAEANQKLGNMESARSYKSIAMEAMEILGKDNVKNADTLHAPTGNGGGPPH